MSVCSIFLPTAVAQACVILKKSMPSTADATIGVLASQEQSMGAYPLLNLSHEEDHLPEGLPTGTVVNGGLESRKS